jgi:hypothetical protein
VRDNNRKDHEDRKDRGYEEEARAHAFAVFAIFVVPNQAAIYVAMYNRLGHEF